ncbi:MAG: FHA domain-containing protein [Deltaproteobacteria bacterium]
MPAQKIPVGSADSMFQVELKVLEGRQQGKTIPLNVRQFLIGREQDCHLRPNSDLVSRHHCVFTVDDFTVRLRDLGSTNGTYVNGERIQGQVVLKPGDQVSVGKLSFEVVVRTEAPVAAAVGSRPGASVAPASTVPGVESSETSLNATDTIEIPVAPPGDDTAILDTFKAGEASPGQAMPQQQPAFLPSMAYPPGYGIPQGYGVPGYPPGYPAGYPGAPGYPAGYGPPPGYMPPGYGMQPMMPGYAMPQQPQAPAPTGGRLVEAPPVVLPDPSQTGAKSPEPTPPPPAAEGQPGAAPATVKPSDAAADIIRSHRTRRTT